MWAMSRTAYRWWNGSLAAFSGGLLLGTVISLQMDWLENADPLVQLAICPGGFIAAGIVFLLNGCVEHYADFLPAQYRARESTRSEWRTLYDAERMVVVESILKQFARSHGFRATDAFQFGPEDRVEDLMREFYPGRSDIRRWYQQSDLTCRRAGTAVPLCLRDHVATRMGTDYRDARGQSPQTQSKPEPVAGPIDRQARNRLANTIRRYQDEILTAFAFDEEIQAIRAETADTTVRFVVDALWFHYDDCKDHLAGLCKEEWDYFQRLILLLESDARIEPVPQKCWSVQQAAAVACLTGLGLCVWRLGMGWHLFGMAILFGPASMLLSYWRNRSEKRDAMDRLRLAPFSSLSELRAVRRSVAGFSKKRYPANATIRRVHGRLAMLAAWLHTAAIWSVFSPLVLLFQTLPNRSVAYRVLLTSETRLPRNG